MLEKPHSCTTSANEVQPTLPPTSLPSPLVVFGLFLFVGWCCELDIMICFELGERARRKVCNLVPFDYTTDSFSQFVMSYVSER